MILVTFDAETTNLGDYETARSTFSWGEARARAAGLADGALNIAYEAVDVHEVNGRADHVAIRWLSKQGGQVDITYGDLRQQTSRFAEALSKLCGGRGARVASLAGRVPELYVAALGTLKAGGVYTPLFSAFGPEPIRQRIDLGRINVLVTTPTLYRRKVEPIRTELTTLEHVILIGGEGSHVGEEVNHVGGMDSWDRFVAGGAPDFPCVATMPEELALLHFTSGTTGNPKGAMHVHGAVVTHRVTAEFALDLRPGDVFWCTADPGWVTGTSYGIIAPLVCGATCIVDEGDFDAARWYATVEAHRVTVWYTAPTAVRMMMRVGLEAVHAFDLSSLRVIASVGEPLNPEAVLWGQEAFGRSILDNWWQTETGGIMISNYLGEVVKPGSMGRPIPGIEVALLERTDTGDIAINDQGAVVEIIEPGRVGELAIRSGWPSMFVGYLEMEERYSRSFVDGWYRSGDLARRDTDGYYWFVGRGDDVIKSAGHLIGPFEVESALMEHPSVSEAAVIGLPDETVGEIVKAFIRLAPGIAVRPELEREVMGFARRQLGAAIAPRIVEVVEQLPKTRSGKIMRRLLKARELGLPEGDTSTLVKGTS